MRQFRLSLAGFGNVGQAFARLLLRKADNLERDFGLGFTVTGIATGRHGSVIDPAGIDLDQALAEAAAGFSGGFFRKVNPDTLAFIEACPADALLENSPVNPHTGEPAAEHLRAALRLGMHAITANKGPVVFAHRELTRLASEKGKRFLFESSVMDGAPIFSLFRETLPVRSCAGLPAFSTPAPITSWVCSSRANPWKKPLKKPNPSASRRQTPPLTWMAGMPR